MGIPYYTFDVIADCPIFALHRQKIVSGNSMLRVISSAWKPHWDYGGRPLVAMSSCLLRFSVCWEPRLGNLDAKRSTICNSWVPASMLEHKVQEKGEKCIHVHRNFAEVDWVVLSYVCFSIRMVSLGSGPSFSGGRNE